MTCPYCGADKARTLDSRERLDSREVYRRRVCRACQKRWTTRELPVVWIRPKPTQALPDSK